MLRAAFFALVGVLFLVEYELSDPSRDGSESRTDWGIVLLFSAALLALAVALPMFARLATGEAGRASLVAAGGAGLSSVANIVEDGFVVDAAFFAFIAGAAILDFGLVALAVTIAWASRGARRAHAAVPVLTLAAVTVYPYGGGYLMLVAWLIAAALAVVAHRRAAPPSGLS